MYVFKYCGNEMNIPEQMQAFPVEPTLFSPIKYENTLLVEPFFCLRDFGVPRKALHELSKIFVEYALRVARIQSRTQA